MMDIVEVKKALDTLSGILTTQQYGKLTDMLNIAIGHYHDERAIKNQTEDLEFLEIEPVIWAVEDVFEPDVEDNPF